MSSTKKGKGFWGDANWHTIHCNAAAYTPEKRDIFKQWITAHFSLLPCKECSSHAHANLKALPIDSFLDNNHDLFFWTYYLHDIVNQQCNSRMKPGQPHKKSPPFDEVKDYYFKGLNIKGCKSCQE